MIAFSPHLPSRFHRVVVGLVLAFGGATLAFAGDWQALTENSPFGAAANNATPATNPGDLEFRGLVREADTYLVNLYNPTTKTSQWVPVNGKAPGLQVDSYEEKSGRLTVTQNGRQMTLPFKKPEIKLAEVAPTPPVAPGPPMSGEAQIRPRPGMRDFVRQLPPDTQALIEEFRRRRAAAAAERAQQMSQQGQNSPSGPTQDPRAFRPRGVRQNP